MKYNFERFVKEKKIKMTIGLNFTTEEFDAIKKLAIKHQTTEAKIAGEMVHASIKELTPKR